MNDELIEIAEALRSQGYDSIRPGRRYDTMFLRFFRDEGYDEVAKATVSLPEEYRREPRPGVLERFESLLPDEAIPDDFRSTVEEHSWEVAVRPRDNEENTFDILIYKEEGHQYGFHKFDRSEKIGDP